MRITLSAITSRRKPRLLDESLREYSSRLSHFAVIENLQFATESTLLASLEKSGRTPAKFIVLDMAGRSMSSEQFAAWLGQQRDSGAQHLHFAIGPADGWSEAARNRADLVLSFGPMTFPHELARIMLAEQLYRAFTILTGHPYHGGH